MPEELDQTRPESLQFKIDEHLPTRVNMYPYKPIDRIIFNSPVKSFIYTTTGAEFTCANGHTYILYVDLDDVFDEEGWEIHRRRSN